MNLRMLSSANLWVAHCCSFFLCLAPTLLQAAVSNETNGLQIAIGGWRSKIGAVTDGPIQIGDRLVFMALCATGKVELFHPLDLAYGLKMKLIDSKGELVAKTKEGKRAGSLFNDLGNMDNTRLTRVYAWGSFQENAGFGGGKFLPPPVDLFRISKPGLYKLVVEMQMFRPWTVGLSSNRPTLIRFPPVELTVEKLSEE